MAISPPADVVEIGAGPGTIATALAARGFSVIATDLRLDATAIAAAGNPAPGAPIGRLSFCVAEAKRQPLAEACADLVVLSEVLEHVVDDGAVLAEARRLLRPGGMLIVSVPAGSDRYGDTDRRAGHFRRYDAAPLGTLLRTAGFDEVRIRPWGAWLARLYDAVVLAAAVRIAHRPLAGPARAAWWPVLARWGEWWFAADERLRPTPSPVGWLVIARRR